MTPSQQIRDIVPVVARQRLEKARRVQRVAGPPIIISGMEEQQMLAALNQEPLTWIMAIMTYLDGQAAQRDDLAKIVAGIHDSVLDLDSKVQRHLANEHGL
jgi:hypothetical protein